MRPEKLYQYQVAVEVIGIEDFTLLIRGGEMGHGAILPGGLARDAPRVPDLWNAPGGKGCY